LGGLVGIAAILAIILGLSVIDSPEAQRMQRLDAQRISDVAAIIRAVDDYWSAHNGQLPETLDKIAANLAAHFSTSDRLAGTPYEYLIKTPQSYQICARFDTEGPHALPSYARSRDRLRVAVGTTRGTGSQCFVVVQILS